MAKKSIGEKNNGSEKSRKEENGREEDEKNEDGMEGVREGEEWWIQCDEKEKSVGCRSSKKKREKRPIGKIWGCLKRIKQNK